MQTAPALVHVHLPRQTVASKGTCKHGILATLMELGRGHSGGEQVDWR